MLRKVSRNCSSELSSAGSAPPKLPVKAPHQRNVPGAQIVETEPENPHRGRNPATDAPPAHLSPDAPATAAAWSSGSGAAALSSGGRTPRPRRPVGPRARGPPLFLRVVERPSRPPRVVEPRRDHGNRVVAEFTR